MKTVADIMHRDVITAGPDTTVRELTQLMSDSQISGVPVVDSSNRVVGVVSATDIVRLASEGASAPARIVFTDWDAMESAPDSVPSFYQDSDEAVWDWSAIAEQRGGVFDETRVADIMTSVPFTVGQDTSVATLARLLTERRIHRALVAGREGLVGVVTTFDLLKASFEEE